MQATVPVHPAVFLPPCSFPDDPAVHPSAGFAVLDGLIQLRLHHLLHGCGHFLECHRERSLFCCPQWCRLGYPAYARHLLRLPLWFRRSHHYFPCQPTFSLCSDVILYGLLFLHPAPNQQQLDNWNVNLAGVGRRRSDACAASLPPIPQRVGTAVG